MINQCTIAQKEGTGHAMPVLSISFIKENCKTVGDLRNRVIEFSTDMARLGTKHPQVRQTGSSPRNTSFPAVNSLMPCQYQSIAIKSEAHINGRH